GSWLNWVLAAFRGQAFPNENEIGMLIKIIEFPRGIDQQAIQFARTVPGIFSHFVAIDKSQLQSGKLSSHLSAPLEMSRDQHQEQVRKTRTQPKELLTQNDFFSIMRAASQNHASIWWHPKSTQHCAGVEPGR